MRSRSEVEGDHRGYEHLQLEVLLDIRDLLSPPTAPPDRSEELGPESGKARKGKQGRGKKREGISGRKD